MILYYQEQDENKFFILLGNSEEFDRWDGLSLDNYIMPDSNQASKVISIGNLRLDELIQELNHLAVIPIETRFHIKGIKNLMKFRKTIRKVYRLKKEVNHEQTGD